MWDSIASSDIEQAKHSLNLRRAETLSRHAEEIKALDTDQTEVDELASAIAQFISKFGKGATSSDAPSASPEAAPEQKSVENGNAEAGREAVVTYGANFRHYG
jgi:hypothetical protein